MPDNVFTSMLEQHTSDEVLRYEDLKNDIKEIKASVEALTSAWNQAKGVLSFVKWVLGISGGVATFFIFIKDHFR